jgi:outer membrane protein assembly factor BamE
VPFQHYRLTVYFKNDVLERFDGDEMPSETEFVQRIGTDRKYKVPPLEATEAQLAKFPPASAQSPEAAASAAATPVRTARDYPPLEPAR